MPPPWSSTSPPSAPTAAGYLTVHPGGTLPNASNLNFAAGQTVAVHVTATVGADDRSALQRPRQHPRHRRPGRLVRPDRRGGRAPIASRPTAPSRALDSQPGPGLRRGRLRPERRTTPSPQAAELPSGRRARRRRRRATAVVDERHRRQPRQEHLRHRLPRRAPSPCLHPQRQGRADDRQPRRRAGRHRRQGPLLQRGRQHPRGRRRRRLVPAERRRRLRRPRPADTQPRHPHRHRPAPHGLGANATHKLKVARYNGVPADAPPCAQRRRRQPTATGYLTVYPGTAPAATSNINFTPARSPTPSSPGSAPTAGRLQQRAGSTHVIATWPATSSTLPRWLHRQTRQRHTRGTPSTTAPTRRRPSCCH